MSPFKLVTTIPAQNVLGECILWDDLSGSVWWTDIHSAVLHRYVLDTDLLETFALPERLCSFGFVAGDRRLICAFASGIALYEPASGDLQWLFRPERGFEGTRFNDGRVDRHGRFWSSTMVEGDALDREGMPTKGSLYRVAGDQGRKFLGDIEIGNSLCFRPDGKLLYFADSPTRRIQRFPLDPATGEPGEPQVFAIIEGSGVPDGSIIDAEGYLWNAQWGGAKIVRYTPAGKVDTTLELPVTQPTCLCFGGPDLDLLFVSTARENLDPAALSRQPLAGDVLVYRTDYKGLPEDRYRRQEISDIAV
jgi:sugar lactone lactonase YvrE